MTTVQVRLPHAASLDVATAVRVRLLDAASLDMATAHYARPREDEHTATASVLVFRVGAEWLALPSTFCDRVTGVQAVHSLPHRRAGRTAGLVPIDGDLVVHLSLADLLGIDATHAPASRKDAEGPARPAVPRLVVLTDARGRVALTVNEVWGVYEHDGMQLRPVPSTLSRALVSYTTAMIDVGGRQVGCLDGPRVMSALSLALA
jgi:chemotaxis-related protein WspD